METNNAGNGGETPAVNGANGQSDATTVSGARPDGAMENTPNAARMMAWLREGSDEHPMAGNGTSEPPLAQLTGTSDPAAIVAPASVAAIADAPQFLADMIAEAWRHKIACSVHFVDGVADAIKLRPCKDAYDITVNAIANAVQSEWTGVLHFRGGRVVGIERPRITAPKPLKPPKPVAPAPPSLDIPMLFAACRTDVLDKLIEDSLSRKGEVRPLDFLTAIIESSGRWNLKDFLQAIHKSPAAAQQLLWRIAKRGDITRAGYTLHKVPRETSAIRDKTRNRRSYLTLLKVAALDAADSK